MFKQEIQERIAILDKNLILISSEKLVLEEKSKEGEAKIEISINNPCILFKKLEEHKLGYFNNYCANCADYIFFEYKKNTDTWILHIVELKKTVKIKEWEKIKKQFKGAILNSLALGGYLGIHIECNNIKLYTGLRNDNINNNDTYDKRAILGNSIKENTKESTDVLEWNYPSIKLKLFKTLCYEHKKIYLDKNTGNGSYTL